MIVKLVHNDDPIFSKLFEDVCNEHNIIYEIYDLRYLSDRKKGYKVKGAFSARLDPFIGIYNDENQPIKGLYSEVGDCTISKFNEYLTQ